MPVFEFEGAEYQNPVELALHTIGGKWKMPILWRLQDRVWRYNELRRDLTRVSHKMLTQQLRELEHGGLITRTVFPSCRHTSSTPSRHLGSRPCRRSKRCGAGERCTGRSG